jgi:flagellar basal body P-ring formation protein FlgA
MSNSSRHGVWFLALLALSATAAEPGAVQSTEELRQWTQTFLTERLRSTDGSDAVTHATAGTVDARLRLQRCGVPLQGIMPATVQASAKMTIGVRCASPAWTVYVPMIVETELKVLVMRGAAGRSSSLSAADVEVQQRRVPGMATGYLTRIEQLDGRHLKMAVSPGTALSTDLLAADILIKRGQRVTLVASAGGLEVQAQGEAIADATPNGRVRVLNLSSRKIVEGQVESSDRVRMSL